MDKPPIDKTREEVEAERKAKRAAKQERKKAALEKQKTDGLNVENQQKSKNQSLEQSKDPNANEPVKISKPKTVSILYKSVCFY